MNNIFKKFLSFIFGKTNDIQNSTYMTSVSSGKSVITAHESMELSSSYEAGLEKAENEIENLIRLNFETPEDLLQCIRISGTRTYKLGLFEPILNNFKIQTGYIPRITGIKAGVLNLILNKKIAFELKDIFITPNNYEKPITFFYQFYMWYLYKNNILYTNEKISSLLFELDNEDKHGKIPTLTYHESNVLSKIVKADIRAIKFVMNVVQSINKTKSFKEKTQDGESF